MSSGSLEFTTLISTCKSNLASSLSDRSHTLTDLSNAEVMIISLAKGWNLTIWIFSAWAGNLQMGSLVGAARPFSGICHTRTYLDYQKAINVGGLCFEKILFQ